MRNDQRGRSAVLEPVRCRIDMCLADDGGGDEYVNIRPCMHTHIHSPTCTHACLVISAVDR